MKDLIKQALQAKTSIVMLLLSILVPFTVFLGDFLNTLYLVLRQKAVVPLLFVTFQLLAILVAGFFLSMLLLRIRHRDNEASDAQASAEAQLPSDSQNLTGKKSGKKVSFHIIMMNFFFPMVLFEAIKLLLANQNQLQITANSILTLVMLFIGVLLTVIFIAVSWFISENSAGIKGYPGAILQGLRFCFLRPAYLIIMLMLWTVTFAAGLVLYFVLWKLISQSSMSALLSSFYLGAMISCIIGAALVFSLKLSKAAFKDIAPASGKGNAAIGGIIMLLFFAAVVYGLLPRTGNVLDQINSNIEDSINLAEQYRNEENLYLCGTEYKKAFGITQALQSYLYSLEITKEKNMADGRKTELTALSDQAMATAYEFYPNSSTIFYLDGMRRINQANPSDALVKMETASGIKPVFKAANGILLDLYIQNPKKPEAVKIVDAMIANSTLIQSDSLDKIGTAASKKLVQKYTEKSNSYMESITAIAMDYYENQLYPEAMNVLTQIQKYSPDALEVNYLIAMTDLEMKTDGKKYDVAIQACQKILQQYPGEAWAEDLLTGVTIRAGNQEAMDQTIQKAYQNNPENPDIAEQYAYSLLRKNSSFDIAETDKTAETVVDNVLKKADDRWFSYYCKAILELKKKSFESSITAFEKFSDLIEKDETLLAEYDDFYNQYILKYAYLMKINVQGAKDILQTKETTNPFLYQYVQGAYYWSIKDFENGKKFMEAALNLNSSLSKPYFLLGDVYFEEGFRKKNVDYYTIAETNYRKALSIFKEDPFAWFSLGHVLKNMERYEEALGAFQKTLSYMPAEDHSSDHFGVSVHAAAQVQELKAILDKKEVK